jgi:flagellar hook-associated protein 2
MAIRMSGIASGLDTESLVNALVSSYNLQKDNLVKAQTKLSWKQDSWKTLNTSIYSFYSGSLSAARLSKTYDIKSATISNSAYAKVSAASSAVNGTQTLKVIELAATGYLTGGVISGQNDKGESAKLTGTSKLKNIDGLSGLTNGTVAATVDGSTKLINLTSDMTVNQFVAELKNAGLNASFDETNQRFFVSSKTSGKDHDFSLTADNQAGLSALQNMGLFTMDKTSKTDYELWASYASDSDKLKAVVDAAYKKVEISNTARAKECTTNYNNAKKSLDAMIKECGNRDKISQDLADQQKALSDTFADYASTDESGNVTYDTNRIKADGKLDEYNKLQTNIKNIKGNLEKYDGFQSTIDKNAAYVHIGEDGFATAATEKDADPSVWNTLVAQVESENNTIYSNLSTSYKEKADFAAKVMASVNGAGGDDAINVSASTGAVRVDGEDSKIELNGATFTNNTNNYSINGLTIQATAKTGDQNVTITTETDVDGIYSSIKKFFKEYNDLIKNMDTSYNADNAKGYEPLTSDEKEKMTDDEIEKWEKKIKDSLLRKDSTLGNTISALKTDMMASFNINGKDYSLASFGIATLGYFNSGDNEKGMYHIDGNSEDTSTSGNTDKLKAAIANDPETVISFFSQLATKVYSDLGTRMGSSSVSSMYKIYNDKEMATEYSDYTTKISDKESEISRWEEFYYKKFSRMESAIASLNSQQSSLSGLFK